MSALADALVAAQSRAVAALGKQYVGGRKLAGEKKQPVPDGPLSKAQTHEIIDTLKAGTYDAGKWAVPFL